ncbi:hypothetical protein BC826DRAFT_191616 [Russula brevipes]|nr:hypothetical protein BC826DRAFT_191616 [Russula brevipes]
MHVSIEFSSHPIERVLKLDGTTMHWQCQPQGEDITVGVDVVLSLSEKIGKWWWHVSGRRKMCGRPEACFCTVTAHPNPTQSYTGPILLSSALDDAISVFCAGRSRRCTVFQFNSVQSLNSMPSTVQRDPSQGSNSQAKKKKKRATLDSVQPRSPGGASRPAPHPRSPGHLGRLPSLAFDYCTRHEARHDC